MNLEFLKNTKVSVNVLLTTTKTCLTTKKDITLLCGHSCDLISFAMAAFKTKCQL